MNDPSGRRIRVSTDSNFTGNVIYMNVMEDSKLRKDTLRSQFANAIGLRYSNGNIWLAVAVDNETFIIPEDTDNFVVVTDTVDRARTILNNNNNRLASQISSVFGAPAAGGRDLSLHSRGSDLNFGNTSQNEVNFQSAAGNNLNFNRSSNTCSYGSLSTSMFPKRKQLRTNVKNLAKIPKAKAFKVVFIVKCNLPVCFSKDLILAEGFVNIKENELESEIKANLMSILNQSRLTSIDNLEILLYSSKTLSVPCSPPGFSWSLETIRMNVGQGKLYIMVTEKDLPSSPSTSNQPSTGTHSTAADKLQSSTSTDNQSVLEPPSSPSTSNQPFNGTHSTAVDKLQSSTSTDNQSLLDDSEVEVTDTGTPTITFRRRLSRTKHTPERGDNHLYRSYIGLLPANPVVVNESDSSESEENGHIQELQNPPMSMNLTSILAVLKSKIDLDKMAKFNISRNDVLDGARRAIHRKSFQPYYRMSIKFTDDIGVAEGAVDAGGPKRELLRLLIRKIQTLPIFEGPSNSRSLAFRQSALQDNLYEDVGVFLAMSIVHGGPCPKFFAKWLYEAIVSGLQTVEPTVEMVTDTELKSNINQLSSASDMDVIQDIMNKMSSMLSLAGCFRPVRSLIDRDKIIKDLVRFVVIDRIWLPLEQLKQGLRRMSVLEKMEAYKETMSELFLFNEEEKLTAEGIEAVYVDIQFAPSGSNRRLIEERIIGYWRDLLMDVEEKSDVQGLSLADILVFGTGADMVPPLGFDPSPAIEFLHSDKNEECLYPKANTCAMVLSLPLAESYESFKLNMIFGIRNAQGFGFA